VLQAVPSAMLALHLLGLFPKFLKYSEIVLAIYLSRDLAEAFVLARPLLPSENSWPHFGHLTRPQPYTASGQPPHATALEYIKLKSKQHSGHLTLFVVLRSFRVTPISRICSSTQPICITFLERRPIIKETRERFESFASRDRSDFYDAVGGKEY
jgi:hypothetical protein